MAPAGISSQRFDFFFFLGSSSLSSAARFLSSLQCQDFSFRLNHNYPRMNRVTELVAISRSFQPLHCQLAYDTGTTYHCHTGKCTASGWQMTHLVAALVSSQSLT